MYIAIVSRRSVFINARATELPVWQGNIWTDRQTDGFQLDIVDFTTYI